MAKGYGHSLQAGRDIVAAMEADSTLTYRSLAVELETSGSTVGRLVALATSVAPSQHDLWQRGSHATKEEIEGGAQKILDEAPMEQVEGMLAQIPLKRRNKIEAALVSLRPSPSYTDRPATDPTFIALIVKVSGALIALESMVADWQNLSAVPSEFSRESFNDIVAKVLRIQDRFDSLASAIDAEDEDAFLAIVRNFRVVPDAE